MKTNPEYYKWGLFYFNREDQRIFVPKVNRLMGWTLNFARPESYVIIGAFVFLMIYLNR